MPQNHVVKRASEPEARAFLGVIRPALLLFTGESGILCREDRHPDMLYDVRAPVVPEVAQAIYALIMDRGMGREDVTEAEVVKYLEEKHGGSEAKPVGAVADGRRVGEPDGQSGDQHGQLRPLMHTHELAYR